MKKQKQNQQKTKRQKNRAIREKNPPGCKTESHQTFFLSSLLPPRGATSIAGKSYFSLRTSYSANPYLSLSATKCWEIAHDEQCSAFRNSLAYERAFQQFFCLFFLSFSFFSFSISSSFPVFGFTLPFFSFVKCSRNLISLICYIILTNVQYSKSVHDFYKVFARFKTVYRI